MNETIINGIDVSKYFIDVVDEGGSTINYKILPNIERLLVERIFEQNQQLKHLQEENEGLKSLNDFNVQKIEVLQEENEDLKKKKDEYYLINLDYETKISYLIQALKEIRKEANRLLYEENPIYGYNNSNYFEILAKYVLAKTDEALNDRN